MRPPTALDEAARAGDDVFTLAAGDCERQPVAVGAEHPRARADLVDRPPLVRAELGEQVDDFPPDSVVFSAHGEEDAPMPGRLGLFTEPLRRARHLGRGNGPEPAVLEPQHPVGDPLEPCVVRDDDGRPFVFLDEVPQDVHHLAPVE